MTSTAHAMAAATSDGDMSDDNMPGEPAAGDRAHRFAAVAVATAVVLLQLASALVRRDWLFDVAFGWSVVAGGASFAFGLLLGGHLSDRIGPRAVFSISATVAMAALAVTVALPVGAAVTGFVGFAATAAAIIAGLLALGRSATRPASAIALVLAAETVLTLISPQSFRAVVDTERPGVMLAGLLLAAIAAVWVSIRCLPLDEQPDPLAPNALYDDRDLDALGRARLLGTAALAMGTIVIGTRITGSTEQAPNSVAIVVCLALLAGAAIMLRTRLLGAIDLRHPFQPALVALAAIAVLLGFGAGLHDVVAATASFGLDARLAVLAPLTGYALSALAIDAGFARRCWVAVIGLLTLAGGHALVLGTGGIDDSVFGDAIALAGAAAATALLVLVLNDVASRAPAAIVGATAAIAFTVLSSIEALGRAFPGADAVLESSTYLTAGAGLVACAAASAVVWQRWLSR